MTISVTQLNNYIRGLIDIDGVLSDVSVSGEITNVKKARDGWYFSLKDEFAAINCFCYDIVTLPETGTVAVVEGQVNYFSRTGSVSLFVRKLTSTQNTGAAYLRFIELKNKLQKEGLFDDTRKKDIPKCCRKIGIVTSKTGAVIRDITDVCLRRQPFTELILYPVKVQGDGASEEIVEGIEFFNTSEVDAIIVGRGGGSNEDLSVFNSENIVRAVAYSVKPIVSAVGHGIDYTLCDFAADRRAVTPTEAAELLTIDVGVYKRRLISLLEYAYANLLNKKILYAGKISNSLNRINADVENRLAQSGKRIDRSIDFAMNKTEIMTLNASKTVDNCVSRLSSLNPFNVLKRGYGYVTTEKGSVASVNDIEINSFIDLTLSDGKIKAQVIDKVIK